MHVTPEQLAQMKAAVEFLAPIMARYRSALIEAGLSPADAMQLVLGWQAALFSQAKPASKPPGE